jgi:CDP-glucose 4,6-dehydratase
VKFLLTGHTGFKGAWLSMWLVRLGHDVSGLALDPEPQSLYERAQVGKILTTDIRGDVRDLGSVERALDETQPEVVLHLAAQPLVRESYARPRWTMETNVMGTLNVLDAAGKAESTRALLVVTTDKVYRNVGQVEGYIETDPLGGDDPYSASKAMADILSQSWARSFPGLPTVIARAGNVIGGGDFSADRLLPDLVQAFQSGRCPELRYPAAVRPWQHVLDCLNGYLKLVDELTRPNSKIASGSSWNFGPGAESFVPVGEVASLAEQYWGADAGWTHDSTPALHEAELLALDSAKAERELGWRNRLPFRDAIAWTLDWYRLVDEGLSARSACEDQIVRYEGLRDDASV